jgi:hypothetical protein
MFRMVGAHRLCSARRYAAAAGGIPLGDAVADAVTALRARHADLRRQRRTDVKHARASSPLPASSRWPVPASVADTDAQDGAEVAVKALHNSDAASARSEQLEQLRSIEMDAWRSMADLPDEALDAMRDPLNTCRLLQGWAYFAQYWDRGVDGPTEEQVAAAAAALPSPLERLSELVGGGGAAAAGTDKPPQYHTPRSRHIVVPTADEKPSASEDPFADPL